MEAKFTLPKSTGINATFKLAVSISEEAASKIKERVDEVEEKLETEITRSSLEDINLDAKINSEALAREVKDNEIETKIDDHIAEEDTKIQNLSDKLDAHISEEDTKIEDLDTKVDGINANLNLRIDEVQQDVNDKYDDLIDDIDDLAEIVDEKLDKNSLINYDLTKLEDYLYSINFNKEQIDYAYALDYFKNNYKGNVGACTSIRKGDFFGRNYDWSYSEGVSFIVKKEASAGRYATIGMSGNVPNFYRANVETMEWNEAYKILPYFIVDGINEYGLAVSVNVVPTGDKGRTTGTHPDLEGDEICMVMLPSYILERFKTAQAAVNWITNEAKIYAPNSDLRKEELHFLIADKDNTFVIEFIDNVANIISDKNYITNFYLTGATFDESGKVNYSSVTSYGQGLERYNKVAEAYSIITSAKSMLDVLRSVKYTNAYNMEDMQVWWKTEFVAPYSDEGFPYPNLTVMSPVENFVNCGLTNYIANQFASRSRATEETWQTIHSSVYDLNKKQFIVLTQEQVTDKVRTFNLLPNVGDGKLVIKQNGVLIGEFNANQQLDTTIEVAKIDYSFSDVSGKPYDNANLAGALYNKANVSEITRIDGELETVNQTINTLTGTVTGNYTDLDLRVKTNANLISQETSNRQTSEANLQEQIDGKQPTGDYATNSRVDGISQTIISDKAELKQDIATLTGTVEDNYSDLDVRVSANTGTIAKEITDRQSAISNLQGQVDGKQPTGDYALRSEVNTEVQRIDGQLDVVNQTIIEDKAELTQNIGNVADDLALLDQKVDVNVENITNLNETIEITNSNLDALTGDVENLSGDVTAISDKISAQASTTNQLADKAFVNSTIQTATANFRGNWNSWTDVPSDSKLYPSDYAGSSIPTVNDYIVVQDPKALSTKGGEQYEGTWRFKYTGDWSKDGKGGWKPEYQINETPLTSAQVAALNSGATKDCIDQIASNKSCIENLDLSKQDNIEDLEDIRTNASNACTNISTHTNNGTIHVTANDKAVWNQKQAAISDLAEIRTNASAGKTASDKIATYGDIVSHNASEFQVAGDYATNTALTSALTPKQNITDNSLVTLDKTVAGAINELDSKIRDIQLFKFPDATIIGSPVINNGQVSSFSSADYLVLPFTFDTKDRAFEINMCFTTGANVSTTQNLLGGKYCIALLIEGGKLVFRASNDGTSWNVANITTSLSLQANITYFVKVEFNKLDYRISYSLNGEDYTQVGYLVSTIFPRHGQVFIGLGNNQHNPFQGIINLNKTYIKLNNTIIWQGMDDAGLATRADLSLSNLDEIGQAKFDNKQDTISDLATIRENASLAKSSVDTHTANSTIHVTASDKIAWSNKQAKIDDLATIRENANAGKEASDTIASYGDIVTHNASEFEPKKYEIYYYD